MPRSFLLLLFSALFFFISPCFLMAQDASAGKELSDTESAEILKDLRSRWDSQNPITGDIKFLRCSPLYDDIKKIPLKEVEEIVEKVRNSGASPQEMFRQLLRELLVKGDTPEMMKKYVSSNRFWFEYPKYREDYERTISGGPAKGEISKESYVFDGTYNFKCIDFNREVKVINPSDFSMRLAHIGDFRRLPSIEENAKIVRSDLASRVFIPDSIFSYVMDLDSGLFQKETVFSPNDESGKTVQKQCFMVNPGIVPHDFYLSQVTLNTRYENNKLSDFNLVCLTDAMINGKLPKDTFVVDAPKGFVVWDCRGGIDKCNAFQAEKDEPDVLKFLASFSHSFPESKKSHIFTIVSVNLLGIALITVFILRKKFKRS